MSKSNGDRDESKVRLRLVSIAVKVEIKVEIKVVKVGSSWSRFIKVDIQTEEYNLNYLLKYLKSVAESGSIIITVPT